MKKYILIATLLAGLKSFGQLSTNVTLVWDYPTKELSTNLTFRVYHTTNELDLLKPVSSWNILTNVPGTNTTLKVPANYGQNYFAVSASNFWSEAFSSVVLTPTLPRSDVNLKVQK
jgi:hypothetical protein